MKTLAFIILLLISFGFAVNSVAAADQTPLNDNQVLTLLQSGYSSAVVQKSVDERGYAGSTDPEILKKLKDAGAEPDLILDLTTKAAPTSSGSTPSPSPSAGPIAGQEWTNSMGMKFVPAGTDKVLFCVWDVRVKDFKTFVDATSYDATDQMSSLGTDGWQRRGDTWKSPGFAQSDDCPVVGVSWDDAHAFCDWLTKKEQAEGKLSPNQKYRLPLDAEWSKAVGLNESSDGTPGQKDGKIPDVYPWGTQWPPPPGTGNFAGSEARDQKWPSDLPTMSGYSDDYPRTSPVGSFKANNYGLFDMSGNVRQWCEDKYQAGGYTLQGYPVLRGGSWYGTSPNDLLASHRGIGPSNTRVTFYGFRLVVVVSP